MRIIFHLGLMKTGTTTIQSTLRANSSRLAGKVRIAAYDEATASLRGAGQRFVQHGILEAEGQFRATLATLRLALEAASTPYAIVSDENIYCRRAFTPDGHLFSWAATALPVISACFAGHDLRIAFYVRAPEAWATSAWKQEVKRGRCVEDYAAWRASLPFDPDWPARFDELSRSAALPITVLEMDAEAAQGRLGCGLLRMAGIEETELDDFVWSAARNEALPAGAIDFMRSVNASSLPDKVVLKVSELVDTCRDSFVQNRAETAYGPPSAETEGQEIWLN